MLFLTACSPNLDARHAPDASVLADAARDDDATAMPSDAATTPDAARRLLADSALEGGGPPVDRWPPGTTVAVPGTYCQLRERIGLVQLATYEEVTTGLNLSARIYDRPDPWYGAPERTSSACNFHRFAPSGPCPQCAVDEVCGLDGACVKEPRTHKEAELELRAGNDTQTFVAEPNTGQIYGRVTLGGRFSAVLRLGTHTITLEPMPLPTGLTNLVGTLDGTHALPDAVDLSWNGPDDGWVYTLIPINHHAGGPTFTECRLPASAHALHVDGQMLRPLAVSTGLEFQGLEHVRTAAAHTPLGCVELRYSYRHTSDLKRR